MKTTLFHHFNTNNDNTNNGNTNNDNNRWSNVIIILIMKFDNQLYFVTSIKMYI